MLLRNSPSTFLARITACLRIFAGETAGFVRPRVLFDATKKPLSAREKKTEKETVTTRLSSSSCCKSRSSCS